MLKRLKAARLDNSHDAEVRKLLRVDLLILDLCRHRDYADLRLLGAVGGLAPAGFVAGPPLNRSA